MNANVFSGRPYDPQYPKVFTQPQAVRLQLLPPEPHVWDGHDDRD